jgi:gamma-glutamylcyclotransferase (GGCT)/AIG2-like uncharacterized protein YtfP
MSGERVDRCAVPASKRFSRLSDLVRDGGLDDLLADLNRSADASGGASRAGQTESLRRLLDRLGSRPRTGSVAGLERAVLDALGRPDRKLAAYGTLVPGERNHHHVAGLGGTWRRCFVRGRRWTAADGDPRFRGDPRAPEVEAMLLVSSRLPSAWRRLDRFEGRPYRRHLVPVRVKDAHHVAYLYEAAARRKSQAISK